MYTIDEMKERSQKLLGYLYERLDEKEVELRLSKVETKEEFLGYILDILETKKSYEKFPNADASYIYSILSINRRGISEDKEQEYGINSEIRGKYESDGETAPTIRILNESIRLDNRGENALVITSKKQAIKDPLIEIFWIWFMQSNNVDELTKMGCRVWNQWKKDDGTKLDSKGIEIGEGTIGTSYGYQIGTKTRKVKLDNEVILQMLENNDTKLTDEEKEQAKKQGYVELNQLEYLVYSLRHNPLSRRIKTTLFNVEDLDEMALEPCVYETHWQVIKGELELTVNIRSNDMALGHPYNVHQYSVLHKVISKLVDIPTGDIVFNIDNVHVYHRHLEDIKKQLENDFYHLIGKAKVKIEDFDGIYDFNYDKVTVENYEGFAKYRYEVVV